MANRALTLARERHQKELEKLKAPAQEAARIEALLASYRKACGDLAEWDEELKDLKRDKEALDAKLTELTKHHKKLLDQFGAHLQSRRPTDAWKRRDWPRAVFRQDDCPGA